jgi:flagellar basal body-associated protein FliL
VVDAIVKAGLQAGVPGALGDIRLPAEQGDGGGTDLAQGQALATVILGAVLAVAMVGLCHVSMVMAMGLGGGIQMAQGNLRRHTACHHQHQGGKQSGQQGPVIEAQILFHGTIINLGATPRSKRKLKDA